MLESDQLSKLALLLAIHLRTLSQRQPASQQEEYKAMLRHLKVADIFLTRAVGELDRLGYTHSSSAGGQPEGTILTGGQNAR